MQTILLALVLAFAAATSGTPAERVAAAPVANDAAPTLAELRNVARPLVVFADSPDDPRFVQQMATLEQGAADLMDRSVVVLTDTDPAAAGPLRQTLRPHGFGLVLIDLDGTIALRRPSPTPAREIVNLIERMPSRRLETGSFRN